MESLTDDVALTGRNVAVGTRQPWSVVAAAVSQFATNDPFVGDWITRTP